MKQLAVNGIKDGTVIDHIPSEQVFRIATLLQVDATSDVCLLGTYLPSKLGTKGIIKLANRKLTPIQTDQIALLAPLATINIIDNFEVVEKRKVMLPAILEGVVACPNPVCITNKDRVITRFILLKNTLQPLFRCNYCERVFSVQDLV